MQFVAICACPWKYVSESITNLSKIQKRKRIVKKCTLVRQKMLINVLRFSILSSFYFERVFFFFGFRTNRFTDKCITDKIGSRSNCHGQKGYTRSIASTEASTWKQKTESSKKLYSMQANFSYQRASNCCCCRERFLICLLWIL